MFEDIDDRKAMTEIKEEDAGIDSGHATESDEELVETKAIATERYTRQIVCPKIVKFIILQ